MLLHGARWPSGLEHWTGDRVVLGLNPAVATLLRNFDNSVYPTLPVSFRGESKSRRSLLSGVYATRGKCVMCHGLQHSQRRTTLETTLSIIEAYSCLIASQYRKEERKKKYVIVLSKYSTQYVCRHFLSATKAPASPRPHQLVLTRAEHWLPPPMISMSRFVMHHAYRNMQAYVVRILYLPTVCSNIFFARAS